VWVRVRVRVFLTCCPCAHSTYIYATWKRHVEKGLTFTDTFIIRTTVLRTRKYPHRTGNQRMVSRLGLTWCVMTASGLLERAVKFHRYDLRTSQSTAVRPCRQTTQRSWYFTWRHRQRSPEVSGRGLVRVIDWLIEQGLTSHQTHYRSYRKRFLQVIWPNQQCQSTELNQLVFQIRLESHQDHSTMLQ